MRKAALALLLVAAPAAAQGDGPPERGALIRADPRFDALVPPGAALEKVADGFTWVEGPVWDRRGGYLLFSEIPSNSVYRWEPGRDARVFLRHSGYTGAAPFAGREPGSNGLTFDKDGRLILCEHGDRRITRLGPDGKKAVLVDRYEGRRLNSPNDAVLDSRGNLYFTDPPFGLPGAFADPARELPWSGVYRLAPDGGLALLTPGLRAPNGIALSPSERFLYVSNADRDRPVILAFELRDDGTLGPGRALWDASGWVRQFPGAPDGMKVDRAGNLFAAGPGGVHVLALDGAYLGTIVTGGATSNVGWGDDGATLYVTAGSTVYRIRTATAGLLP